MILHESEMCQRLQVW